MVSKIYKNGRLMEIQDNGRTIWTEEDSIRRNKISEKSRNELYQHIKEGEFEEYAKITFEILTGKTVEQFEVEE